MLSPQPNFAKDLLKKFCTFYTQRHMDSLLNLFSPHIHLWGTARDEVLEGIDDVRQQMEKEWTISERVTLTPISFVSAPTNLSWVAAICEAEITIKGTCHKFTDLRFTVTAQKELNAWKIVHGHCSFPDQRNPEGSPFPLRYRTRTFTQ